MNTTLSISKKGMFLNNDRINLLKSDFRKLLSKYKISDDSEGNCVIFYSYVEKETIFIPQLEIWLTKDKTPLSKQDIKKIEALQKEVDFTYNKKITLNTTVHFESETGTEQIIPTGFEFIDYDCSYFENTKIGLRCFLLLRNPLLINEEAVQKVKRIPSNIFNAIDAGAGFLELLLNCGVNPNEGLHNDLFTPLMYAVSQNNINAAKILLEHGANVNAVTVANGTALRIAVYMKNIKMAALLIEYGADVNFITDGTTNLRAAIEDENQDKDLIRLLSLFGGKINIPLKYYCRETKRVVDLPDLQASFFLKEDLDIVVFLWQIIQILKK